MRKALLLATASSLAIWAWSAPSAVAADMPVKAPPKAADPFSWTGFYAGMHAGIAQLTHRQVTTGEFVGNNACRDSGIDETTCDIRKPGATVGGHVGYNWQSQNFVYGVEADVTATDLSHSQQFLNFQVAGDITEIIAKVDWLASARARFGIAFSPAMVYVTGGVAFGQVRAGFTFPAASAGDCAAPRTCNFTIDKTKVGWVVGAGVEQAFAQGWSWRMEVLHYDLGRDSISALAPGGTYTTEMRHSVTTGRVGFSLRW
jgi:outer membrane immunogenic protein